MAVSCAAATTSASASIFLQLVQTLMVAQCGLNDASNYPADRSEEIASSDENTIEFDFVIVGAGTAGSIVANRLTEVENWKVLLIEAGDDPSAISEVPGLFMQTLSTPEDYSYDAEPDQRICQSSKNKVCKWNKGKAFGGCSTINGFINTYGNDEDYNEWSRMGNEGWSYEEVLPYFQKSLNCDHIHGDKKSKLCGHGPIHFEYFNNTDTGAQKLFMDAARELNLPILETVNGDEYIGYGTAPGNTIKGRRMSTAKAFLSPIKDRSNFYVMKSSRADAVILDDTRAIGVRVTLKDDRSVNVKASKEVILSAGSIASPQLLMLSGIGPNQHLLEIGIPSVVDLPVGQNLQNHVGWQGLYLAYKNETATPPPSTLDEAYQYLVHQRGSFATNGGFDFVGFVNVSDSSSRYPDIQFFHAYYPRWHVDKVNAASTIFSMNDDIRREIIKLVQEVDVISPMPSLLKPKSRGELRLRSKNPADPVKIYANCFSEQEDIEVMFKSLNFIKRMLKTEVFVQQGVRLHHLDIPGCRHTKPDSDEYWRCNLRHLSFTYFHAVGTAKMGPKNDSTAVVDARLRVHGVQGLRVIDVSVMPMINSATTVLPAMMIGEKGADLIKQDWLNPEKKNAL